MSNAHDSLARSPSPLKAPSPPVSEQLVRTLVADVGRFVTITEGRKITILRMGWPTFQVDPK